MRPLLFALTLAAACGSGLDTSDQAMPSDQSMPDFDMSTTAPGGDGGLACGNSDCLIGGDFVCCIDGALRYCASASACSSGSPAFCDGPEDCPGAVCCVPSDGKSVVCRTQCSGTIVCHVDGDCPADTPRCCGGETLGGYGACTGVCLASTTTR